MNPLTRLFRKQSAPQGVTLEIQSGFTSFSGTAYGCAAFRSAVDAIARQPEAADKIQSSLLIGCALAEATAVYGLVIGIMLILFS